MMNKKIVKSLGFIEEVKLVENNICPVCFNKIDKSKFRDKLSLKEYKISGLCQNCQDNIYNRQLNNIY